MLDKEQLKKIIMNYEETISALTSQVTELKKIALENGVFFDDVKRSSFDRTTNIKLDIVSEIEKKRQEIFEHMKKVKEEAQDHAKKVMENAVSNVNSSASMVNSFPSMGGMKPHMPTEPSSVISNLMSQKGNVVPTVPNVNLVEETIKENNVKKEEEKEEK